MRIAVDGYELVESGTGVGRVVSSLLPILIRWLPEDEIHLFTRSPFEKLSAPNLIQKSFGPTLGYFRWQNGPFRRGLRKMKPDILIASNYTLPAFSRWRSILIEHDVSFVSHPEWFSRQEVLKRRLLVRKSLRKSDRVVTISEFSKNEIIKCFDIDPSKIKVIFPGVDRTFRAYPQDLVQEWKERKGFQGKKIIGFLGSIFNRRNIPLLVEAVTQVRVERPDVLLFIVGRDMTYPPQELDRILDREWIRWEETMDEKELPLFYSALDVFAYLSEYEGFGLPPLEALACGTVPVLLNASSLGEIYQNLSFLVDDRDALSVASVLLVALENEGARQLIFEGFERKKDLFNWERAAGDYLVLIKDLLEKTGA